MFIKRLFEIRNKKYNNGLEKAQQRANELHNQNSNAVVCTYCGNWLCKEDAATVYDIENDRMEYSHEDCWKAYNKVYDSPPIPK